MKEKKKVEIYSSQTCPFCQQAKDFFADNNIEYIEYDIMSEPEHQSKLLERSGQSHIPAIFIDGELVIGFDESKLKELLEL